MDNEEDWEDIFEDLFETYGEQSDVDSNVWYLDMEAMRNDMDGLHQILFQSEEQRERRGNRPAGHTEEDLKEMPDWVTLETLVEAEYGEVKERMWIDGLEMDMDVGFEIEFYGGAYLVKDEEGFDEFVLTGYSQKPDGTIMGDELSIYPPSEYEGLEELVEYKFIVDSSKE